MMEKKEKIQLGITGVLVIVLVFFLMRAFEKKEPPPSLTKAREPVTSQGAKEPGLYARLEQEIKKMDIKRDPFLQQSLADMEESQVLHLSGVVWDEANPTAIIDDEIVAVGSEINGKKIVEIRRDKVILEADGQTTELGLE